MSVAAGVIYCLKVSAIQATFIWGFCPTVVGDTFGKGLCPGGVKFVDTGLNTSTSRSTSTPSAFEIIYS